MESKCPDDTWCMRGMNLYLWVLRMFEDTFSLGSTLMMSFCLKLIRPLWCRFVSKISCALGELCTVTLCNPFWVFIFSYCFSYFGHLRLETSGLLDLWQMKWLNSPPPMLQCLSQIYIAFKKSTYKSVRLFHLFFFSVVTAAYQVRNRCRIFPVHSHFAWTLVAFPLASHKRYQGWPNLVYVYFWT